MTHAFRAMLLLPAVLLAASAGRALAEDLTGCTKASGEAAIGACTGLIASGKYKGRELALLYHSRGNALEKRKDFDRALADHSEAIKLYPADASFWNARCWTRAISGKQLEEAFGDCIEAIRLKPQNDYAYDSLGLVNLRLGQIEQSIADYNSALKINPALPNSLYGRGLAKLRMGDQAGGNADIAAAKAIKPDIAEEYAAFGVK